MTLCHQCCKVEGLPFLCNDCQIGLFNIVNEQEAMSSECKKEPTLRKRLGI